MPKFKMVVACGAMALLAADGMAENGAAARGKKAYGRYCVSCHGLDGDGRGYEAQHLDPTPRNFTKGAFKWRTTLSGQIPRDEDLLRTIRDGLYGTAMPPWGALADQDLKDLVAYVKTFSPRFAKETPDPAITIPPQPPNTASSIAAGKQTYETVECGQCHGDGGRGDGPSASTLRDEWGQPIKPHDFTTGNLKCGNAPEDVYRVFITGLNGTPMPSFADSITPDKAWQLVHYVLSLRQKH